MMGVEKGRDRTDEWAVELRRWVGVQGPRPALEVMSDHCYEIASDLSEVESFLTKRWQRYGQKLACLAAILADQEGD